MIMSDPPQADVLVHRMLDACITSRESDLIHQCRYSSMAANPNEVKFHMDRDQVAKCAQQCNMKKRLSSTLYPTLTGNRVRQARRRSISPSLPVHADSRPHREIRSCDSYWSRHRCTRCGFRCGTGEIAVPHMQYKLSCAAGIRNREACAR